MLLQFSWDSSHHTIVENKRASPAPSTNLAKSITTQKSINIYISIPIFKLGIEKTEINSSNENQTG